MARIIEVKNNTATDQTWAGQTLTAGEIVDISSESSVWAQDSEVFNAVASGELIVRNENGDITDPITAWNWLEGNTLPHSKSVEGKLAVHASTKPEPPGTSTYVVWTGAGDDLTQPPEHSCGTGDLLAFNCTIGTPEVIRDVKFDPSHGRVWIHEAYLKFENGGFQDYVTAEIIAPGTVLQTAANLDLVVDGDGWVKYAPGGAGTGTHGFAATPVLISRTFSKDGDWDYDGTNLLPNFDGTGRYKININEVSVHKYVNKIPCFGTSTTYFSMTSDETAELPVKLGYFIRIRAVNASNTNWSVSIFMEIFRERTVVP